jgi:hypothetical protein
MNGMETGTDFLADFIDNLWIRLKNFFRSKTAERNKNIGKTV